MNWNVFEHMESTPSACRYKQEWTDEVGDVWVCVLHHSNSKHEVTGHESTVPCLAIDPYEEE